MTDIASPPMETAPARDCRCPVTKLGRILTHMGLALMIGGMLALGAFAAPTVFKMGLSPDQAGELMTTIFRKYDIVLIVAGVMVGLGELAQYRWIKTIQSQTVRWVRYGALFLLLSSLVCSIFVMHPKLEQYQKAGVHRDNSAQGQAFDTLHKQSEGMYKLHLGLATILLVAALL